MAQRTKVEHLYSAILVSQEITLFAPSQLFGIAAGFIATVASTEVGNKWKTLPFATRKLLPAKLEDKAQPGRWISFGPRQVPQCPAVATRRATRIAKQQN